MLNNMKYISSVKTKIIPSGLHIGQLCIWVDFSDKPCKASVCLSSGVTTYYDNLSVDFFNEFEFENETFVFNNGDKELLEKILPELSKKNNIFLHCENTEIYTDILKYADCVELNVYGKCKDDFENQLLGDIEFYVNLHVDSDYNVEDLIEYCEKIRSFDPTLKLVLTPFSYKNKLLPSEETLLSLCLYGNEYIETFVI